ncbi:unnamed protein product [Phytophthora fragariaefolia]|uniref:Unnamed protein product n=1 Tax=Phytophthora fragariaefolia TaxID=1490495 RepID=A0A9W6XT84_9STRA|nr:unnamed protein product [Phytophthora fragariaefolia]
MEESLRSQQARDRPRVHDMNTVGLPNDPPPLGSQSAKSKKANFVPGTPVQRRLIAGKLIRSSDLEEYMLNSSASAPELSRAMNQQIKELKGQPESDQDTLDLALTSATKATYRAQKTPVQILPKRELDPAEQERQTLRQLENQLQEKLLHVTQKLSRKYTKELAPRGKGPTTTCKIHSLAQKWGDQHQDPESATPLPISVDNKRYNLYAAGRFSTQTELDYYPRKIEPREPATDKHRRHTMHTKYGNALAKSKCSLRGPF